MAKQLLIETRMNALSLQEGVQSKNPNCLGTIKGPCADWGEATRNGNYYSRKLWENVFKDPLVKEALEDRVLLGELDHPADRLEASAANACIVMTGYDFDDDNKVLIGTFDILPTPSGKILRSLLDYGCKIGVSSRGEGDVTEGLNGRNDVADDGSYYFVGFDAVAMPAVQKAKPMLQESIQKRQTFKDSLTEQINTATTKAELDVIRKVVEATELPELDSLVESIDIKSKELEGINDSSNLMEDLERSMNQVKSLEGEVKKLTEEVTDCKSRIGRYVKATSDLTDERDQLKSQLENYQECLNENSKVSERVGDLEKKLQLFKKRVQELQEKLRIVRSENSEHVSKIQNLEESLEKSQGSSREKSQTIKKLREELAATKESLKDTQKEIRTSETTMQRSQKSLEESTKRSQDLLREYAIARAKDQGIDSNMILEAIKPNMSTADIDKLITEEVDRVTRYRKIPVVQDKMLSSLSHGTVKINTNGDAPLPDNENSQTLSFMEQFYHQK